VKIRKLKSYRVAVEFNASHQRLTKGVAFCQPLMRLLERNLMR